MKTSRNNIILENLTVKPITGTSEVIRIGNYEEFRAFNTPIKKFYKPISRILEKVISFEKNT